MKLKAQNLESLSFNSTATSKATVKLCKIMKLKGDYVYRNAKRKKWEKVCCAGFNSTSTGQIGLFKVLETLLSFHVTT